jgi:hypothetical protein
MRVIQAAALPPTTPGIRVRRVEAILDGARVVVQVDGVVVVDAATAEHADATAHGLVWRTSEDGRSTVDNFSVQGTPRCVTDVSLPVTPVNWEGATITATVTAPPDCRWTLTTDGVTWLSPMQSVGMGSATVSIVVSTNTLDSRTGHVVVSGRIATVTQSGLSQSCQPLPISLTPTAATHASGGGSGPIGIVNERNCVWSAVPNSPWIHLSASTGGSSASISYTVDANAGPSRIGTVTFTGVLNSVSFTVTQDGTNGGGGGGGGGGSPTPVCAVEATPAEVYVTVAGAAGQISIASDCNWTVQTTAAWLHVDRIYGQGSSSFAYTVDANPDRLPRFAAIGIEGKVVRIFQDPGDPTFVPQFTATDPNSRLDVTVESLPEPSVADGGSADYWRTFAPPDFQLPSCRDTKVKGNLGEFLRNCIGSRAVCVPCGLGAYMYNPIFNYGLWWTEELKNHRSLNTKVQWYPPHGSQQIKPGAQFLNPGDVFTLQVVHLYPIVIYIPFVGVVVDLAEAHGELICIVP